MLRNVMALIIGPPDYWGRIIGDRRPITHARNRGVPNGLSSLELHDDFAKATRAMPIAL
jgi:hypothetical protein